MRWDGLIMFLGTSDLEASHRFYSDLLGLPLVRDQGVCRIYEVCPGAFVGFCRHHPVCSPDESPIVTLLIEDVDGVCRQLRESGVEITSGPELNPRFNIYHFFCRDPMGYRVEVQKFLD